MLTIDFNNSKLIPLSVISIGDDKDFKKLVDDYKRIAEESAKCNRRIGGDNCECCRNHRRNLHR